MSKVHQLLIKVHDILDNAVSKGVGNSAHILAHVFNSAFMQCHEFMGLTVSLLHGLKDVVPPSEAFLYVYKLVSVMDSETVLHRLLSVFSL